MLMTIKHYRQLRVAVTFFISFTVAVAVNQDSYLLAVIGVLTGMLFIILARSKTKITIDEREKNIREKAAQLTYSIFAPTIGIGSFLLLLPSSSGLAVFSKGEFAFLESLGMVFAYLTLFLIAIYSISYHFLNKKYGGGDAE